MCCSMAKIFELYFHFNASASAHNTQKFLFFVFLDSSKKNNNNQKTVSIFDTRSKMEQFEMNFFFIHSDKFKRFSGQKKNFKRLLMTIYTYNLFAYCVVKDLFSNICNLIIFIQSDLHFTVDICFCSESTHLIEPHTILCR